MQAALHGVLPVQHHSFGVLQTSSVQWSNRLRQALAVCNGLTFVNKTTVVGLDMERKLFKAVEAQFLVRDYGPLECMIVA